MVIMVIEIVVAMRVIVSILVRIQMVIGLSFRLRGVGLSVCNNRECAGIRLPRQRFASFGSYGVLAEKSQG